MSPDEVELWGFPEEDVERVRELVEKALDVRFALHESESIGPYYFAELCAPHAELTLRPNLDPGFDEADAADPEDALVEPDFPDFGVLLYVDWHTAAHDCRERVRRLGSDAQLLLVE